MEKAIKDIKGDGRITNAYIIAFVLILTSYFASIYTNKQLVKQTRQVAHTSEVIINLEMLTSTIKDAENGARGYIITKDIDFLAPYYGTRKKIDSLYQELSGQVVDKEAQQERLKRLHMFITERMQILALNVAEFESNEKALTDTIRGRQADALRLMYEIRNISRLMQLEERRLLQERSNQLQKTFDLIDVINFISLVIAFFLIIFGFFTYRKENKARHKAVQRINDYQEELQNRVDELDKANKELVDMKSQEKFAATGRIARTIAHEVRNPLTNIDLATDQLKTEIGGKEKQAAFFFEMIERNSERIKQLISNLLYATKFSELNYQVVSLHQVLDDALREAEDRLSIRNVIISKKYKSGICNLKADVEKLKIAFLNIIINAADALALVDEPRQLVIETRSELGKCKVLFIDNGPGIDNESLQKIFEPYFTKKADGSGLGLTNSQNIILNHKGDISIISKEGEGATVIVTLDFA